MKSSGKASLLIVCLFFIASLSAPLWLSGKPNNIDLDSIKLTPSIQHPFGTDNKGRDIFVRVIYGARISIGISIAAAIISASIGSAVGLIAGYAGGRTDRLLMSLVDFILSFPSLLFAIALSIAMPSGIVAVMIAISAVGWTSFARLVRGTTLSLKNMPFVDSARSIGCSDLRIIIRHIAPQCLAGIMVIAGIKLGGFILTEATLGFLGLGLQPPEPSWGGMINAGRHHIMTAPWIALFPGLAIFITVFCFNLFGESLRRSHRISD